MDRGDLLKAPSRWQLKRPAKAMPHCGTGPHRGRFGASMFKRSSPACATDVDLNLAVVVLTNLWADVVLTSQSSTSAAASNWCL